MFRKLNLQPLTAHEGTLEFEWDPEGGTVRGRDAQRVQQLVDKANRLGSIVGHPYPTPFDITDPLRRAGKFAVVLRQYWRLDDEFAAAYPVAPENEAPAGAVY